MAFSKGFSDRSEGHYYLPQPSPREESPFPTFTSPLSPLRTLSSRVNSSTLATSPDARGSLTRRFTTNALPNLSPLGQQRRAAAEPKDYMSPAFNKITPTEKKARQYEELLAQQRRIQAQMALIDPETRREVEEHQRLEQDITMFTSGHQSEPTTPPELYSSARRPNHFSSSSLTSPPGFLARPNRSGSQLTSPPSAFVRPFTSHAPSTIPSKSVPASRRGSDEEEEDYAYGFADMNHRAAANLNRNSMPVKMADLSSMLGSVNTASFLFGDEDDQKHSREAQTNPTASPDAKTFLQLHTNDDKFPILVRREGDGNMQFPASSAGMDLAVQPQGENQPTTDRVTAARNRQSLPPSAMRQTGNNAEGGMSPLNGILTDFNTAKNTAANRRSLEVKFTGIGEGTKRPGLLGSPKHVPSSNSFPKLQSSYSTNDIPTLKSTNAANFSSETKPTAQFTQRDFASPEHQAPIVLNNLGSPDNRQIQDNIDGTKSEQQPGVKVAQRSSLQANAMPFGYSAPSGHLVQRDSESPEHEHADENNNNGGAANNGVPVGPGHMNAYGMTPAYYGGYGMQMLGNGFQSMSVYNHGQWPGQVGHPPQYGQMPPQNGQMPQQNGQLPPGQMPQQMPAYPDTFNRYAGYSQATQGLAAPRVNDSQHRIIQSRRNHTNGEDNSRFANVKLEALSGEIYGLCKDQHGCRYLQKKLEERVPEQVAIIFDETAPHVVDLMTDPFGNYLCQKLLEYATDDQRTVLIRNAAPQVTKIALNQHGTRALQKMIEFVSTREQIQIIIEALEHQVVPLIQDLNGNHVIQKCLNHLSPEDAQFIFSAVGTHCVTVGTHRHGCCVLQRCIDHASGLQKGALVQHITDNAFSLVQDPFGNYVVQYILDLGEPAFSEPLCHSFEGNVAILSKQKFSSNVIEKCIRTASPQSRRALVDEIMNPLELEKLLRDSFANYVVQTAMDYVDEETKIRLIDNIRPIIPAIRHTPYGRRIQGKIQDYDNRMAAVNGMSPISGVPSSAGQVNNAPYARGTYTSPTGQYGGNHYGGSVGSPPQRGAAVMGSLNMMAQPQQANTFNPANGYNQANGYGQANTFNQGFSPRQTGVRN